MASVYASSVRLGDGHYYDGRQEAVLHSVIAAHGAYTATSAQVAGPTVAAGAEGLLVKGLDGTMVVAWAESSPTAPASPAGEANVHVVMEGEADMLPVPAGWTVAFIELA